MVTIDDNDASQKLQAVSTVLDEFIYTPALQNRDGCCGCRLFESEVLGSRFGGTGYPSKGVDRNGRHTFLLRFLAP